MGYSITDWKHDIKLRVEQLKLDIKKKELDALDAQINSLVSPEQRREMELNSIMARLAD